MLHCFLLGRPASANMSGGTRSPQMGSSRHGQEVCGGRGGEKELFKIERTNHESL
jgi:hypothetical protein